MSMKVDEIKKAVNDGLKIRWMSDNYHVIKDGNDYLIHCTQNDTYIGLTWKDGITLNGKEDEFYEKA